jgi:tRNA uridine 5-carboxymethylaminomethyl modification enzyme
MTDFFDIIVIGGGHAGCEAASIAAKLGSSVLLISLDLTKLAQMSCNPSIGGIGKGQIVKEIDVLGGYTAKVTDLTTIQFRMLNKSKGPAMWSPRAQCDRMLFSYEWRKYLESIDNLHLFQDEVVDIDFDVKNQLVSGVTTQSGIKFKCNVLILTNGTFLKGKIHIGSNNFSGGRFGEKASIMLSDKLEDMGLHIGRMKTGTPVRIDGRSVDFSKLLEQKPDTYGKFSLDPKYTSTLQQKSCYVAHTNSVVHDIIREGFDKSPLFSGKIKGIGPRYCPSIEDKVRTFYTKDSHQLFLEPEGVNTYEMYLNGFSSSLPVDIQLKALKNIEGFENVSILRPGYAIEYDYFDPMQLNHTLAHKSIKNLFFAGQVNGTTGYEEAAGQGLLAGINAHYFINDSSKQLILGRNEAYIGVLIDDLVTKGVDEPYRMFTSRAEYRILIRQDNVDERLLPIAQKLKLASNEDIDRFNVKSKKLESFKNLISSITVSPQDVNDYLVKVNSSPIEHKRKLNDILARPDVNFFELLDSCPNLIGILGDVDKYIAENYIIKIKYSSYEEREQFMVDKTQKLEALKIPNNFNYESIRSLSTESRQKLSKVKPKTIGQAKNIPGVSPSDINVLLVYLGR